MKPGRPVVAATGFNLQLLGRSSFQISTPLNAGNLEELKSTQDVRTVFDGQISSLIMMHQSPDLDVVAMRCGHCEALTVGEVLIHC